MFDNIGGKIKSLAIVSTALGMVGSLVGFFFTIRTTPLVAFLILLGGCFMSWVGSFGLYGLGQLIENSDTLVQFAKKSSAADTTSEILAKKLNDSNTLKAWANNISTNTTTQRQTYRCAQCYELTHSKKCEYCGYENTIN